MKRFLLFSGIGVAVILILGWAGLVLMNKHTKSFSPELTTEFDFNGGKLSVFYNRPFKKGRDIFGGLVPYGKVWRTGANEATSFSTTVELAFGGKVIRPGTYSLWTIPEEDNWTIILNSEHGQWGINSKGEANRNSDKDVASVEVPVVLHDTPIEQFTISFESVGDDAEMVIMWDKTVVAVPITRSP